MSVFWAQVSLDVIVLGHPSQFRTPSSALVVDLVTIRSHLNYTPEDSHGT